jgi:hypothetical protein
MASLETSSHSRTDRRQMLTLREWVHGLFGTDTATRWSDASYPTDSKGVKSLEQELEFAPWKRLQSRF